MKRQTAVFLNGVVGLFFTATVAGATVIHVPGDSPTVQGGIDLASPGDTVSIDPGTYSENLILNGKTITFASTGGKDVTILRPADPEIDILRVGPMLGSGARVIGLTFRDENYFFNEAIDCDGCALEVYGSLFANNREAAVWVHNGGSLIAQDNVFVGNRSNGRASAINCPGFSTAIIERNIFEDNSGGAYFSPQGGGAVHLSMGNYAMIMHNLFVNNRSTATGGAIEASLVDMLIFRNNTIDSNSAAEGGAAVHFTEIEHLENVGNVMTRNYGVPAVSVTAPIGVLIQDYNDVWHNAPADYGSDPINLPGDNSINSDPQFELPGYTLAPASPCIDAGDPAPQYNDADGSRDDMGALPRLRCVNLCQCHGDPECDGALTTVDVVKCIDVAFRGETAITDPEPECLWATTDVNCSNGTDIVDVIKMIEVALRGVSRSVTFCPPCSTPE